MRCKTASDRYWLQDERHWKDASLGHQQLAARRSALVLVVTSSTVTGHQPTHVPAFAAPQISKAELGTAMSFLRGQLGEDELRHLLEQLSSFNDKCASALCADISVDYPANSLLDQIWFSREQSRRAAECIPMREAVQRAGLLACTDEAF